MGDFVAVILEKQVAEYEDYRKLKLFTEDELREIATKRRDFEYLLKRRAPRKVDYIRYIKYEMELDETRKERKNKLRIHKACFSDNSCMRHVHFIFERLVRRFPGDKDAWRQYISFCQQTSAFKTLSKLFPKALRLHPHDVEFWIRAAAHELNIVGSMDGARLLMQRALRFTKASRELWLAYFKLELECLRKVRDTRIALGMLPKDTLLQSGVEAEVDVEGAGAVVDGEEKERELSAIETAPADAAEVERKAAEGEFMSGGVLKIIHKHATLAIPNDPEFELTLLDAVLSCRINGDAKLESLLTPQLAQFMHDAILTKFPQSPEVWSFMARHVSYWPPADVITTPTLPTPTPRKRKANKNTTSTEVSLPQSDDVIITAPCAMYEQGFVAVSASSDATARLLQLYMEYLRDVTATTTTPTLEAKLVEVSERLLAANPTVDVASQLCAVFVGQGRRLDAVHIAEQVTSLIPLDVHAWLLLCDVTQACMADESKDGNLHSPAIVTACLAVLDRAKRVCVPNYALGSEDKRELLEVLLRRRVELHIAGNTPSDTIAAEFTAAKELGLLERERQVWECVSNCTC